MAAGEDSGGGWWGGWLQAAKEKSASALEMVKKDLAEFTCTMQADTSTAVVTTSDKLKETLKTENTSAAKDRLKNSVTSFLEGLSKALVIEAEDKNIPVKPQDQTDAVYDRAKARLHAIQVDPGTYCNEPTGSQEQFKTWEQSFDIETYKGDISELLVCKVEVRTFYTKLVPGEMSHADFWKRYFYKVHQLQQDEARKLALMKRAEQAQKKEDSISWEDDWSGDEESGEPREKDQSSSKDQTSLSSTDNTQDVGDKLSPAKDSTLKSADTIETSTHCDRSGKSHENIGQDSSQDNDQTKDISSIPNQEEKEKSNNEEIINKEAAEIKATDSDIPESEVEVKIGTTNKESFTQKVENIDNESDENKHPEVSRTDVNKEVDVDHSSVAGEDSSKVKKDNIEDIATNLKTKDKGDVVVVNPDRDTPTSESSGNKENSLDDDWEQDFDVELTEEDMKTADEIAKKLNISATDYTKLAGELEEDWESWE